MKKVCREMKKLTENILIEGGGRIILVNGGRHPALLDTVTGRKQPMLGSPSDHRAVQNMETQVRRWLREIGLGDYRIIGENLVKREGMT